MDELRREMGLKSLIKRGQFFFGIRVIKEELMLLRQTEPSKKSLHKS
jgi:hypothetical protein